MFRRNVAALLCLFLCLLLCAGARPARVASARASGAAPLLIAEEGTDNAVAVEPVTRARDPFPVTQVLPFSADPRWDDSELNTLKALKGSDFEVVKMGTVVTQ